MARHGGQRAAARSADIGAGPRPRAVERENGEEPSTEVTVQDDQSMIDLEFLRGLIEAVDNSSVDSLEIRRERTRIRISKTPPAAAVVSAMPMGMPQMPAAPAPAELHTAAAEPVPALAQGPELVDVKSPMVGTFYRAPAPEAPPYAEVGTVIKKGQTLCILEAMKLMNELEAEVEGTVREILVENADPVEYGQVLFRIEPS